MEVLRIGSLCKQLQSYPKYHCCANHSNMNTSFENLTAIPEDRLRLSRQYGEIDVDNIVDFNEAVDSFELHELPFVEELSTSTAVDSGNEWSDMEYNSDWLYTESKMDNCVYCKLEYKNCECDGFLPARLEPLNFNERSVRMGKSKHQIKQFNKKKRQAAKDGKVIIDQIGEWVDKKTYHHFDLSKLESTNPYHDLARREKSVYKNLKSRKAKVHTESLMDDLSADFVLAYIEELCGKIGFSSNELTNLIVDGAMMFYWLRKCDCVTDYIVLAIDFLRRRCVGKLTQYYTFLVQFIKDRFKKLFGDTDPLEAGYVPMGDNFQMSKNAQPFTPNNVRKNDSYIRAQTAKLRAAHEAKKAKKVEEKINTETVPEVVETIKMYLRTGRNHPVIVAFRDLILQLASFHLFSDNVFNKIKRHIGMPIKEGFLGLIEHLLNIINMIYNYGERMLKGERFVDILRSHDAIEVLVREMQDLLTYEDNLYPYAPEPIPGKMEADTFIMKGKMLLERLTKTMSISPPCGSDHSYLLNNKRKLELAINAAKNLVDGVSRVPPYAFLLVGSSHSGKSLLFSHIMSIWFEMRGIPFDERMIYHPDDRNDFDDLYDPSVHKAFHFSELGNESPTQAKNGVKSSVTDLLSLVDGQAKLANKSNVNEKGKTWLRPEVMGGDTNNKGVNAQHRYYDPSAAWKRFLYITVEVLPEFRIPGTVMLDKNKSLASDRHLLDKFHFTIERYQVLKQGRGDYLKVMEGDIFEMSKWLYIEFKAYWESQIRLMERSKIIDGNFYNDFCLTENVEFVDEKKYENVLDALTVDDYIPTLYDTFVDDAASASSAITVESWPENSTKVILDLMDSLSIDPAAASILNQLYHCRYHDEKVSDENELDLIDDFYAMVGVTGSKNAMDLVLTRLHTLLNFIAEHDIPLDQYGGYGEVLRIRDVMETIRVENKPVRIKYPWIGKLYYNIMSFRNREWIKSQDVVFAREWLRAKFYEYTGIAVVPLVAANKEAFSTAKIWLAWEAAYQAAKWTSYAVNPLFVIFILFAACALTDVPVFLRVPFVFFAYGPAQSSMSSWYADYKIKFIKDRRDASRAKFRNSLSPTVVASTVIAAFTTALCLWKVSTYFKKSEENRRVKNETGVSEHESKMDASTSRYRAKELPGIWNVREPGPIPVNTSSVTSLRETIKRNVRNVTVCVNIPGEGERTLSGPVLGLKSNYVVMPAHTAVHIENFKISFYHDNNNVTRIAPRTTCVEKVYKLQPDLFVFKVEKITFADITKHMPSSDLSKTYYKALIDLEEGETTAVKSDVAKYVDGYANTGYNLCEYFEYPFPSHKVGKSGLPLIVEVGHGSFVAGIHVGGSEGIEGYAQPITQSMVAEAVEFLRDEMAPLHNEAALDLALEEPIMKSPVFHLDLTGMEYRGKLPGKTSIKKKSQVLKTPWYLGAAAILCDYGFVQTQRFMPPLMEPGWKNTQYLDPWGISLSKMSSETAALSPSLINKCVAELTDYIVTRLRQEDLPKLQPLDMRTAINSVEHDKILRRINATTSGGFDFQGRKADHMPIVDGTERAPTPRLREEIERLLDAYAMFEMGNPVVTTQLKDEPRAVEKVAQGKTRLFCVNPLAQLIVSRMMLAPFNTLMIEFREIFHCAIGLNVYTDANIVPDMQVMGQDYLEGDYGSYDQSMPFAIGHAANSVVYNVLKEFGYNEEALKITAGVLTDLLFPVVTVNNDVFVKPGYQPSGKYGTAEDNSLRGILLLMYAWYSMTEDAKFFDCVNPLVLGDDMLATVDEKHIEIFNNVTYQNFCKKVYKMDFTSATKSDKVEKSLRVHEVSFLKRKYVWNNKLQRYLAPLDQNSIFRMLQWYVKSRTEGLLAQTRGVLASVSMELALHLDEDQHGALMSDLVYCISSHMSLGDLTYLKTWREMHSDIFLSSL